MTTAHCSSSTYMLILMCQSVSVCLTRYGCTGDFQRACANRVVSDARAKAFTTK